MTQCPDYVRECLDATGFEWRLVPGKKHLKVFVGGRMAAVLSKGTKNGKCRHQIRDFKHDINRVVRLLKGQS